MSPCAAEWNRIMFKFMKKTHRENNELTVISKGIKIEAALISGGGVVRIEGEYCGEIKTDDDLVVAKSGRINGNICVESAYISGNVTGNIKCFDLLHITSTGKVNGDIECEAVLMDEGAVFTGYSKMKEPEIQDEINNIMETETETENDDPLGLEE